MVEKLRDIRYLTVRYTRTHQTNIYKMKYSTYVLLH